MLHSGTFADKIHTRSWMVMCVASEHAKMRLGASQLAARAQHVWIWKEIFFLSKRLGDFDKWVLIKNIYQITTKDQYHFVMDVQCPLSLAVSCLAASLSARAQGLWTWNNTDGLFCPLSRGDVTAGHQDKLSVKEIASQIIILLSSATLALCALPFLHSQWKQSLELRAVACPLLEASLRQRHTWVSSPIGGGSRWDCQLLLRDCRRPLAVSVPPALFLQRPNKTSWRTTVSTTWPILNCSGRAQYQLQNKLQSLVYKSCTDRWYCKGSSLQPLLGIALLSFCFFKAFIHDVAFYLKTVSKMWLARLI